MADLAVVDLEWRIWLAKNGDGELLAELLRRNEPIHATLREFLAEVVAGKIKLKRPILRPRTYMAQGQRWHSERMVVHCVNVEMGKRRNTHERTHLIDKFSQIFRTTPNAVGAFLKHGRTAAKRRASERK
jgi:hypothetical protein